MTHPSIPRATHRTRLYWLLGAWIPLVGICIRLAAAWGWQYSISDPTCFKFGDSDTYWLIAKNIADGNSYQYGSSDSRVFRAPLYPLFLVPWTYFVGENAQVSRTAVLAARFAGCVLGGLCIALVIWLARPLANKIGGHPLAISAGLWAGLLVVLYPGAIGMSVFVLSEAIFCPFMLLSLGATFIAIDREENSFRYRQWMLVAGLCSGLACLARPSWSLWPIVLFPYLLLMSGGLSIQSRRFLNVTKLFRLLVACIFFLLGICIAMSPWWIRNYAVVGKFVPTTLQVGASLYDGWHPGATGSSDENMFFVNAFIDAQREEDSQMLQQGKSLDGTLEWRIDRRLRNAAIQWARENSSDALRLGLIKWLKTWSPFPVAKELGSDAVRWMEAIGYSSIMLLGAVGLWKSRCVLGAWLFAMPCVYFALLHMFFIGSVRYRQPAVLVMCVLGGLGCATLMQFLAYKNIGTRKKFDGSITASDVTADSNDN